MIAGKLLGRLIGGEEGLDPKLLGGDVLGMGFSVLANFSGHLVQAPLGAAFEPHAWSRPPIAKPCPQA